MVWRLKAAAHWLCSSPLPGASGLEDFFHRYVRRTVPESDETFKAGLANAVLHLEALNTWPRAPLGSSTGLELGAGWNATLALFLWSAGVRRQHLVDIRPHLTPGLVAHCIEQFQRLAPDLHSTTPFTSCDLRDYGIDYHAPIDVTHVPLADGSIDFVTSTNTLEHIPKDSLRRILSECRRLLRPDGAMSHVIDYADQYSYFDRSIGPYNCLRYSDRRWSLYNPPTHYQNRLRHSDYLSLFAETGFRVVSATASRGDARRLPSHLAQHFLHYALDDLLIVGSHLVAMPC